MRTWESSNLAQGDSVLAADGWRPARRRGFYPMAVQDFMFLLHVARL